MPQKTQTIFVEGYNAVTLTALAYGTLESQGWTIKYVAEGSIIAYTPKSWNKYDHEIAIETANQQLTISSKHIHGEIADLPGRNKKFIAQFLTAFESLKAAATEEQINDWKEKTTTLQQETIKVAGEEIKQSIEIDKVMNLSKSNLYATYGIMAINVIVFIMMTVSGVSLLTPTGIDIIKWGGNHASFTLSGDWWRLISCVFVHIGIIHLVFNMYALFMIGVYLEPMLGKARFIAAYLATGICASVASLWWHKEPIASAGASGAIFGMYGVFLAFLSTNLIPKQVRDQLLKSIAIFIGYNLLYGMRSGVDNSAHIGGLLSGLVIGYIFYLGWKGENAGKKKTILASAVLIASMALGNLYLNNNKVSDLEKKQINYVIKGMKYKDGQKFMEKIQVFAGIEEMALAPLHDTSLTYDQLAVKMDEVSLPEWNRAGDLIDEMKTYEVSDNDKKKITLLAEYVELRKKQVNLIKTNVKNGTEESGRSLSETTKKIEDVIAQLSQL